MKSQEYSKKKILIIDDDVKIKEHCQKLLATKYELDFAGTGKQGLEKMQNQAYNLVIIELRLPDMEGFEVLRQIKDKSPECPVIVMSRFITMNYQDESAKLGACDYLIKDDYPRGLASSVESCFKNTGG
jgi:DNA-binding NtrC family response regulator